MVDTPQTPPRDHAQELRDMRDSLLAGGADWSDALLDAANALERMRAALEIIAGGRPCIDNLLGNADLARIALHGR